MIDYFLLLLLAFLLSALLTKAAIPLAKRWGLVDDPRGRHEHLEPTPKMGGLAIYLALSAVLVLTWPHLVSGNLTWRHWLGVWLGATIVVVGGWLDDKLDWSPAKQFVFPVLACAAVLLGGVNIEKITSPLGGYIYFDNYTWTTWGVSWSYLSAAVISLWLLGMMYTTKLLDGLDGLVSGVSIIAALIIFLFTVSTRYLQPDIAWAALAVAGAAGGFLVFNWQPAKIFLGESGALLLGFLLGVLSIISGGKFAIALLIMGIPILDVAWTIIRRLWQRKNPFKTADRRHLHFRLLDAGLSQRWAVAVFYVFAALFGLAGLFLQSQGKVLLLSVLALLMLVLIVSFYWLDRKTKAILTDEQK